MKPREIAVVVAVAACLSGSGWLLACRASAAMPGRAVRPPQQQREFIVAGHDAPAAMTVQDALMRTARLERLKAMRLDRESLAAFIKRYRGYTRGRLIADGLLVEAAPGKGTAMVGAGHRSPEGNALLQQAKDMLYGLLFGDEHCQVRFERVERELLTLNLPRAKAQALGFMQAATELTAAGTWQDPEKVSNDERADNVIIEVEYGEVAEEAVGDGIVTALALINNLEVNEQVLYARMTNVEQSTLIE